MTRFVLTLAVAVAALAPAAGRADEADDILARRMSAMVRDFRLPMGARVEAARTLEKLGPRASAAVPHLVAVLDRHRGAEQEPHQQAVIEALGVMG